MAQVHDLQDTLYSPPRQGNSILRPGDVQNPAPADQISGVIRFRQDRPRQTDVEPPSQSRTMLQIAILRGV